MIILAIDTSTARGAVAALHDDQLVAEETFDRAAPSPHLFGVIESVLREAGLAPPDIELYGVGVGPGSFTGIRGGIAAVKGLALPRSRPIRAVNSFAALALTVSPQMPPDCQQLCVVGDAKRGEIYCALYDPDGRPVRECQIGTVEGIAEDIHDPIWFVSPEIERFRQPLTELLGGFASISPTPLFPSAAAVGRLAYRQFVAAGQRGDTEIEPVYLRATEYKTLQQNREKNSGAGADLSQG